MAVGPGLHDVSLAHAAEVHNMNSSVVLGNTVGVAARAVGLLSYPSRSSS